MQQSIDFQSLPLDKQINAYIAGVILVNVTTESIQIHWSSIMEKQITDEPFSFLNGQSMGGCGVWQPLAEVTLHELLKARFTTY